MVPLGLHPEPRGAVFEQQAQNLNQRLTRVEEGAIPGRIVKIDNLHVVRQNVNVRCDLELEQRDAERQASTARLSMGIGGHTGDCFPGTFPSGGIALSWSTPSTGASQGTPSSQQKLQGAKPRGLPGTIAHLPCPP